ncbi:MAG: ABC transporter permease subunit [Dehalococcoidia bacterium]|jgi:ABC-2 type transport system permease protein|tara:strand:- start:78 stop:791 length:714 start_codon:yes stop_codon:yes gene_type:complete
MRNLIAITLKETRTYFGMPSAYIVGAMFLMLTGIFFVFEITRPFSEAGVRELVDWASFFTVFLAPLITMRLLAEEQKLGTLELLLTSPVHEWQVVTGKYLSSLFILLAIQAVTLYYVLIIYIFGNPDMGPVLSAYIGLILHGATALSVGLLGSSLSSNQIVAAVLGTAVLLFFAFIDRVSVLSEGPVAEFLNSLSMTLRLSDFTRGIIDTSHLVYFLSLIAIFLFLTIRSLETRRWK